MLDRMPKPVIILENPKYAGNIGMICRLIANFNLSDLRILGNSFPFEFEMEWMAHNATDELNSIRYFSSFEESTNDLDLIIGTGMIRGSDRGKFISINEAKDRLTQKRFGFIFGREDTGLSLDTIIKCDFMIDFQLPGKQKSMNLANSVSFLLGSLAISSSDTISPNVQEIPIQEKKYFYEFSKTIFEKLGMNDFHENESLATKRWKTILEDRNLSRGDYGFLFKMLKNIEARLLENENG